VAPIGTFGANHELMRALNAHGARYLVVGGAATIYYVPDRPTEHAGELDLLIDRSVANVEKVLAALRFIGYFHPDYTVERISGPKWVRLPVNNGSLYADILTPEGGEDFDGHWKDALDERIDHLPVKVISIKGQIGRLSRSPHEKHKRDVELLKSAPQPPDCASVPPSRRTGVLEDAMKIGDVFDVLSDGTVRAKRKVTITGAQGSSGTVSPGSTINAVSSIAGTTGQWIAANVARDVPPSWKVD
jgi:hypothetical protein